MCAEQKVRGPEGICESRDPDYQIRCLLDKGHDGPHEAEVFGEEWDPHSLRWEDSE